MAEKFNPIADVQTLRDRLVEWDFTSLLESGENLLNDNQFGSRQITDTLLTLSNNLIEVLQQTSNSSDVKKIRGLIIHDCRNLYGGIIYRFDLFRKSIRFNTPENKKHTIGLIDQLLTLINITIRNLSNSVADNTLQSIHIKEVLDTLGHIHELTQHSVEIVYDNSRSIINFNDFEFYSIEEMYCIRTLLLNSLQSGASVISIELGVKNGSRIITVVDNSADGHWPDEFRQNIMREYQFGIDDDQEELKRDEGGSSLVAQLAGKRHRIAYFDNADLESQEAFVKLQSNINGGSYKSISIRF